MYIVHSTCILYYVILTIYTGRRNFSYGFGYGAETASIMSFSLVLVSASMVSAKFQLWLWQPCFGVLS